MRKILSLTLVAVMLLSTLALTSCNEVLLTAGGYVDGFINGVIDYFTPAPTYRTEITEMEWYLASSNANFTISTSDRGQEMTLVVADNLIKVDLNYVEDYKINLICDLENRVILSETKVGYLGYKEDSLSTSRELLTLGNMGYFPDVEFSELVYDAEKGAYAYDSGYMKYECYFREGKLFEAKIYYSDDEPSAIINNIGTSVVEIGEYTIINDGEVDPSKAPADVRTTVTNEELAAHLDMRNFTINAATMQIIYTIDIDLKVADTALDFYVGALGSELMHNQLAIINDELYSIGISSNQYVATSMGATMEEVNQAIEDAKEYMSTDYLVYDEEGRYYILEVEGYTFCLYFEDGKLVKGECIMPQSGMGSTSPSTYAANDNERCLEIVFVVTDIGTTVVELPDYEIVE